MKYLNRIAMVLVAVLAGAFGPMAQTPPQNVCGQTEAVFPAWMKGAYGYTFDGPHSPANRSPQGTTLDNLADAIDVQAVAQQAKDLGAAHVMIALGWTTGAYTSHNSIYDSLAALQGLRLTPRRNLLLDLANALQAQGLHCGVYIATDGPKSGQNYYTFSNWSQFWAGVEAKWKDMLKEWWSSWGGKVDIYWLDGCCIGWKVGDMVSTLKQYSPQAFYCCACGEFSHASSWYDCGAHEWVGGNGCDANVYYAAAGGWGNPNFDITVQQFLDKSISDINKNKTVTWDMGYVFQDKVICPPVGVRYFSALRDAGYGFKGAGSRAPKITSSPKSLAAVNAPYTYTVTAAGAPLPTISAAGLPSWLAFNASTATFSGTPADTGTTGTITVTATNSQGSDRQTFTITVGRFGTGVRGEYYDNANLTGLKLTRIDPVIDFDWGQASPDPSMGADGFSIRWTGEVLAQYSETYTFYTLTDDGVRLWVNNQLVVNHWMGQSPTEWSGTISLTAGQKYTVKMEYYDEILGASARLSWSSPSLPKEIIPQIRLYPDAGAVLNSPFMQTIRPLARNATVYSLSGKRVGKVAFESLNDRRSLDLRSGVFVVVRETSEGSRTGRIVLAQPR
jgi:hypothetical protein